MNYLILFILCLKAFILSSFTLCFVINMKIRQYLAQFDEITKLLGYINNKEREKKFPMSRLANNVHLCSVLCSVHIAETYMWHF